MIESDTIYYTNNQPREGEHKEFHENGELMERVFYKNGKPEGKSESWYENGQRKCLEFFRDGCLEGKRQSWYENGQLKYCEFYLNGKERGKNKCWYNTGKPCYLSFSDDGTLCGESRHWEPDGSGKLNFHHFHSWTGWWVDFDFSKRKIWTKFKSKLFLYFSDLTTESFSSFLISDLAKSCKL